MKYKLTYAGGSRGVDWVISFVCDLRKCVSVRALIGTQRGLPISSRQTCARQALSVHSKIKRSKVKGQGHRVSKYKLCVYIVNGKHGSACRCNCLGALVHSAIFEGAPGN